MGLIVAVSASAGTAPAAADESAPTAALIDAAGAGPVVSVAAAPDGGAWYLQPGDDHATLGRIMPDGSVTAVPIGDHLTGHLAVDGDGNVWFNAAQGLGRITPDGVVTMFPVPVLNPTRITTGPDGNVWFALGYRIGRVTPEGQMDVFVIPANDWFYPVGWLAPGPDGNVWFTRGSHLGRIDPSGTDIVEFTTGPFDLQTIAAGPDGNMWFRQAASIGRLTPAGVRLTDIALPLSAPAAHGPLLDAIGAAPDGSVWVAMRGYDVGNDIVARVSATGAFAQQSLPRLTTAPHHYLAIAAGPDGDVWFGNDGQPVIGRVRSAAGTTPTVSLSAGAVALGAPLTITTSVAGLTLPGTPMGTVVVSIDGTDVASLPLVGGQAQYTTAALTSGQHQVRVRYLGDASYLASTSVIAPVWVARPTVLIAAPAVLRLLPLAAPVFKLSATLRYADGIQAREFVVEMVDANGQLLCTAWDATGDGFFTGTATCDISSDAGKIQRVLLGNGYTAIFRGDRLKQPSQGHGPLVG
jgi:streptogramin lyase